jgi:hypothetical protein
VGIGDSILWLSFAKISFGTNTCAKPQQKNGAKPQQKNGAKLQKMAPNHKKNRAKPQKKWRPKLFECRSEFFYGQPKFNSFSPVWKFRLSGLKKSANFWPVQTLCKKNFFSRKRWCHYGPSLYFIYSSSVHFQ